MTPICSTISRSASSSFISSSTLACSLACLMTSSAVVFLLTSSFFTSSSSRLPDSSFCHELSRKCASAANNFFSASSTSSSSCLVKFCCAFSLSSSSDNNRFISRHPCRSFTQGSTSAASCSASLSSCLATACTSRSSELTVSLINILFLSKYLCTVESRLAMRPIDVASSACKSSPFSFRCSTCCLNDATIFAFNFFTSCSFSSSFSTSRKTPELLTRKFFGSPCRISFTSTLLMSLTATRPKVCDNSPILPLTLSAFLA
mmetsp:Transcript_39916/g.125389  ORF Transcript_39916/g.125389 Transcript_39916/m.125389 type:complete len:261 (+) Transcript_39916:797-1579(+)